MTVLDAQAVMAYLRAEPAGPAVKQLLSRPTAMSVLNAGEVTDQLVRRDGERPDDVEQDFSVLERAGMRLVPLTEELAFRAGQLRAQYYQSRKRELSMADCVAAATALGEKLPLATSDPALVAVMRAEGGDVHALPDSKGVIP